MQKIDEIGGIHMRDLQLFHEVSRAKSIREAGRRLPAIHRELYFSARSDSVPSLLYRDLTDALIRSLL